MFVTAAYAQSTPAEPAGTPHDAPAGTVHTEPGAVHTETGAAEHGSGVFPPFDSSTFASQLLWLAVTFGLFYLLISRVILPRIGAILETRHTAIAQDLDEASRAKAEADAAIAAYEQDLSAARTKGNAIASTARDAAKAKAGAERAAIEADLNSKIAAAQTRIAEVKATALADVDAIAEETATAVIEMLIGGTVPKVDIESAVRQAAASSER